MANHNLHISPFSHFYSSTARALKCYEHGDDYDLTYTPTNEQKASCNEDEDVCAKIFWTASKTDPSLMQVKRKCRDQEFLKNRGWQGSGCAKKMATDDDYREYTYCGCTTDYCNTSTFAKPFSFLPIIALSMIKMFFMQ